MGDITSLLDRCTWHYMKLRIYAHRQAMTIKCPARYHRWARFQGSRSGGCSLLFADVAGKSSRASSPFVVRDTSCSQGFYFMHLCKVSSIQPEPEQIYDEQRRTGVEVMGFLSLWWGHSLPTPVSPAEVQKRQAGLCGCPQWPHNSAGPEGGERVSEQQRPKL